MERKYAFIKIFRDIEAFLKDWALATITKIDNVKVVG